MEQTNEPFIEFEFVKSENNTSDILSKPVRPIDFQSVWLSLLRYEK
jgi:hypothetical protein